MPKHPHTIFFCSHTKINALIETINAFFGQKKAKNIKSHFFNFLPSVTLLVSVCKYRADVNELLR